jgi:hypothetical protein
MINILYSKPPAVAQESITSQHKHHHKKSIIFDQEKSLITPDNIWKKIKHYDLHHTKISMKFSKLQFHIIIIEH